MIAAGFGLMVGIGLFFLAVYVIVGIIAIVTAAGSDLFGSIPPEASYQSEEDDEDDEDEDMLWL